jgi:hypothetical protein
MSKTYTITISDAEQKALEYVFYSPQDWIESALKERATLAMQEIADYQIRQGLVTEGTSIEDVVLGANVRSVVQRRNDIDAYASSIGNTSFIST